MVGSSVGSFLIEELIAQGTGTLLYRGRDAQGRSAAVKVLRASVLSSPKVRQRFFLETAALRTLRHPNIVEIWQWGELNDGRPYLATEWLDGQTLAAEIEARGRYSARDAWVILSHVASALSSAHACNIVHRDLKAQNVMLQRRAGAFTAKLLDFGIAKLLEKSPSPGGVVTSTGVVLGSPVSMAPEQIRGERVDARTDVYAFGVLVYQLITGRLPFSAASVVELQEMHLSVPAPRPSEVAVVAPAFDEVVEHCMQKKPELRFASIDAALEELNSAFGSGESKWPIPQKTVGVYFEVRLENSEGGLGDEAFARAEDLLQSARESLLEAGLSIAWQSGAGLFAAAPLPTDSGRERQLRGRLLQIAIRLAADRTGPVSGRAAVCVEWAAVRNRRDGSQEVASESLLNLADWAGYSPHGVTATAPAVDGLEERFVLTPLKSRGDLYQVSALEE